jgi:hypothetical protein
MLGVSCEPPCPRHPFNRNLQSSARENPRKPGRLGLGKGSPPFATGTKFREEAAAEAARRQIRVIRSLGVCCNSHEGRWKRLREGFKPRPCGTGNARFAVPLEFRGKDHKSAESD